MHPLAAGAIVGTVIKRIAEGDCPTTPAFDVETLESALVEVNRMFQAEQKIRDQLQAAVTELIPLAQHQEYAEGDDPAVNRAKALLLALSLSAEPKP
jgi:hypothetical protein